MLVINKQAHTRNEMYISRMSPFKIRQPARAVTTRKNVVAFFSSHQHTIAEFSFSLLRSVSFRRRHKYTERTLWCLLRRLSPHLLLLLVL